MIEAYLERAKQLSQARELVRNDAEYASATALLAIHTAIALNDALMIKLTGKSFQSDNHMAAVREIRLRCNRRGLDSAGVDQLQKLIEAKSKVSYGGKRTTFEFATVLAVACIRFEKWAYQRLEELR
jgi:hypothetical protein